MTMTTPIQLPLRTRARAPVGICARACSRADVDELVLAPRRVRECSDGGDYARDRDRRVQRSRLQAGKVDATRQPPAPSPDIRPTAGVRCAWIHPD